MSNKTIHILGQFVAVLQCCGVAIRSIFTSGISPIFADELDEAIYSLFLRDVLLDTLLGFVEGDLATTSTYIAVIGIGHLTWAVHNTAHDTYLQSHHILRSSLDLSNGLLQIIERTTTAWARDILGLGKLKSLDRKSVV